MPWCLWGNPMELANITWDLWETFWIGRWIPSRTQNNVSNGTRHLCWDTWVCPGEITCLVSWISSLPLLAVLNRGGPHTVTWTETPETPGAIRDGWSHVGASGCRCERAEFPKGSCIISMEMSQVLHVKWHWMLMGSPHCAGSFDVSLTFRHFHMDTCTGVSCVPTEFLLSCKFSSGSWSDYCGVTIKLKSLWGNVLQVS